MKITFLFYLLLCFSEVAISQVPEDAVALEDSMFNQVFTSRSVPKVTGKLLNISPEKIKGTIITYSLVTPFAQRQIKKTATVNLDGSFSLQIDYAFPYQEIWLRVGDDFYAGIYANKNLYLQLDIQKIKASGGVSFNGDGVKYLGEDGPLNDYLNNYILYKRADQLRLSDEIYALFNKSRSIKEDIVPLYNNLFDSVKQIEDSYISQHPSPYAWVIENERLSNYYAQICVSHWGKVINDTLWQKVIQHKSYIISNNSADYRNYLVAYLNQIPGNQIKIGWRDITAMPDVSIDKKKIADSLIVGEKMDGAIPYTSANLQKWTKQLEPLLEKITFRKSLIQHIQKIDSIFPSSKADLLKFYLNTSTDIDEQEITLSLIKKTMHSFWCIAVTENEHKHAVAKINEINKALSQSNELRKTAFGKPLIKTSFGATMYKISQTKIPDFLSRLKQSFPGKAIIIDRWATWCGPCLNEMPHSKQLQEESKDLPVVFVYLCTINGSSESKWKSKVAELKQPGVHFLIDEKMDSDFSNYFSFSGYPGYAYIDKKGNYKPGAFERISEIKDKEDLTTLLNN